MTYRPALHRSVEEASSLFQAGWKPALRQGYTLVEIMIATALSLILMVAVVNVFAAMGKSINNSRAALENGDRLRAAAALMRMDIAGITVKVDPPRHPEDAEGYLEIIEKGYDPPAVDNITGNPDTTVGQRGDILMFTTRSPSRPFTGRAGGNTMIESDVAEVAWFVRGRALHRRVLLIAPGVVVPAASGSSSSFYLMNDVSVYVDRQTKMLMPNTLATLTRRECRFAHPIDQFPFDVRRWGQYGLPTLRECSSPSYDIGSPPVPANPNPLAKVDLWGNVPGTDWLEDDALVKDGKRISDDVVLSNVIGFDVKVWDNGVNGRAGGFIDLGTNDGTFFRSFNPKSGLVATYDTFSFHYENEGIDPGHAGAGIATNGFDDTNTGVADSVDELIAPPPYAVRLRGIQVKIRVFEPDSRQIREVTIEQDFLPK